MATSNNYAKYSGLSSSGGGVTSLNGLTGALTLVGAGGITITPSGQDITITGTGGTVTSVSVVSANGFAGTVANPTSTPAITLTTTVTGILQGNGTAISAATIGNISDAGTDGIVITGGTNAVLGSGVTIAQTVASASANGYLSSTDWTTFNNKQAAGNYITALTGDVTATGPGSAAATLATVNSNVGSFSPAAITVNGKGLVTAASSVTTGNLTDVGTDGITVTGGTGAVLGSGTSISQQAADATHNGYLKSTDWVTFNNKQPAGNYANTALSNLITTSINQNLLPASGQDLGSSSSAWSLLYVNTVLSGTVPNFLDMTGQMYDSSGGTVSIDWEARQLKDTTGTTQLSYGSGLVLNQLTASTVPYLNASKALTSSAVTPTELGYVSGVTSAIQTQLNGKQATGNYITSLTGDVTASGPGAAATSLATVNSNVGSFTNANITVNAKGLITAASSGSGGGSGTVTSVSVVSANGLAGSVATATTTPAITLSTTITGILQGNGTAISAATTTGTGSVVLATAPTMTLTNATGLPLSTGVTGILAAGAGGTGQSTYAVGDMLWSSVANSLSKLTIGATGNVLRVVSSSVLGWQEAPVLTKQVFSSSGTFTIPANTTMATNFKVTIVAGGGGGGGGNASNSGGGGGGGGTTVIKTFNTWTAGNTITVTVGASGSAGGAAATGGTGGTSSVSSGTQTITTTSAGGGAGGVGSATTTFNAGGLSNGGGVNADINIPGQGGAFGMYTTAGTGFGGLGGSSSLGGGGNGGSTAAGVNGVAGVLGAGGGGGGSTSGTANGSGGAGGTGIVIFEWVL